jgi:hypothetical protein
LRPQLKEIDVNFAAFIPAVFAGQEFAGRFEDTVSMAFSLLATRAVLNGRGSPVRDCASVDLAEALRSTLRGEDRMAFCPLSEALRLAFEPEASRVTMDGLCDALSHRMKAWTRGFTQCPGLKALFDGFRLKETIVNACADAVLSALAEAMSTQLDWQIFNAAATAAVFATGADRISLLVACAAGAKAWASAAPDDPGEVYGLFSNALLDVIVYTPSLLQPEVVEFLNVAARPVLQQAPAWWVGDSTRSISQGRFVGGRIGAGPGGFPEAPRHEVKDGVLVPNPRDTNVVSVKEAAMRHVEEGPLKRLTGAEVARIEAIFTARGLVPDESVQVWSGDYDEIRGILEALGDELEKQSRTLSGSRQSFMLLAMGLRHTIGAARARELLIEAVADVSKA